MIHSVERLARRSLQWACHGALLLALAAILVALLAPSLAVADEIPPPKVIMSDANGVDLLSGDVSVAAIFNSIGPKIGGITSTRTFRGVGPDIDSLESYVRIENEPTDQLPVDDNTPQRTTLVLGGRSMQFYGSAGQGPATPVDDAQGSFNTGANATTGIIYTAVDGTQAVFTYVTHPPRQVIPAIGKLQKLILPTGEILTFSSSLSRRRIESSLGYVLLDSIAVQNVPNGSNSVAAGLAEAICDAASCTGTQYTGQDTQGRMVTKAYPNGTSGTSYPMTITSPNGVVTTYTLTATPWSRRVSSVQRAGQTWGYAYTFVEDVPGNLPLDGILTTTVTAPDGVQRVVKSRLSNGHVLRDEQGIVGTTPGRVTAYVYQDDLSPGAVIFGFGKLKKVIMPEGDAFEYTFDAYNNVTSRKHYPKPGSTLSFTEVKAGYSCRTTTTTTICNLPDWTRDELDHQTDFTYYPTHGGVDTVTTPAGPNGVQPQTRYTYQTVSARYYDAAGNEVSGPPVWRVASTKSCRTQSTCAGTADEAVTEYVYQTGTSFRHNANLISVTTRAGNSSISSTTTFAYNSRGDVIETDGPLAGNVDLVQTRYDASRWVVGTVGPDPDGGGALQYRASKAVYRADGQVQTAYSGNVVDRLDATFNSSFQVKSSVTTEYDTHARPVAQVTANGSGTTFALTQTKYDTLGRVDCVAVRMNTSAFASRPDACTRGVTGTDGPDRITKMTYDAYNQVTAVQSGVGGLASEAIYERRATYTANGQVETEKDGENNLTTYAYDGLDRLWRVYYPNPGKGNGGSSASDYEEYGYSLTGAMTSQRRRDGNSITYNYDNLNRLWTKSVAATAATAAAAYTYGYDNFSNMTSASIAGGQSITRTFDAFSRMKTETGPLGVVGYNYDAASRRIQMSWPDSAALDYEYDYTGAPTYIRRSATVIAQFAYDDLGRRQSVTRNGVATGYGYDPVALRLSSLSHNLAGIAEDVTFDFLNNAAGQIRQRTISNSAYVWSQTLSSGTRTYASNGLNQMTAAGSTNPQWSVRGNLQFDGAVSYKYDLENHLRGVTTTGADLAYDPLERLYQTTTAAGVVTRYLYDGPNIIGEYNSSNTLLRRYVHGLGSDELLARYVGASTDPEWLFADHQGSIVAATNSSGAILLHTTGAKKINTYDEYGAPGQNNDGLFQYTGQVWLADLSLYHYKARAYSPFFGRFLQTDPIGYDDGLNWYAYVGNDPMNAMDPSGLQMTTVETIIVKKCGSTCQWQAMQELKATKDELAARAAGSVRQTFANIKSWHKQNRCSIWEASDILDQAAGSTKTAAIAGGGTSIVFGAMVKSKKAATLGVGVAMTLYAEGETMSLAANIGKAASGDFKPIGFDFAGRGLGAATPRMAFKNSAAGKMQDFSKSITDGLIMDKLQQMLSGKSEKCPF